MKAVHHLEPHEDQAVREAVLAVIDAGALEGYVDYGVALSRDRNGGVLVSVLPVPAPVLRPQGNITVEGGGMWSYSRGVH